jgi:hypothetical protein
MKLLILLSLLSTSAYPHGMNKPGPNNGHIRMIGTIHTELVLGKNNFKVYLLDIGFKNETVKKSKVEAYFLGDNQLNSQESCTITGNHFNCNLPKEIKNLKQIKLKVVRDNYSPKDIADYSMPLNFDN